MNLTTLVENRKIKNNEMRIYIDEAKKTCQFFFNAEYIYSKETALQELGVESELLDQLLEDFIVQIIHSNKIFRNHLNNFKEDEYNNTESDYTSFKELIHKNLGVARNLRIKDSEEVLKKLMETQNTEEIDILLDVLEACVVLLQPIKAYNSLQIISLEEE